MNFEALRWSVTNPLRNSHKGSDERVTARTPSTGKESQARSASQEWVNFIPGVGPNAKPTQRCP